MENKITIPIEQSQRVRLDVYARTHEAEIAIANREVQEYFDEQKLEKVREALTIVK